MGHHNSKHVDLEKIPETSSSQDFVNRRRSHYQGEFIKSRKIKDDDEYDLLSETERVNIVHSKRTTFLEPPAVHDEDSKEIFKQRSIRSEINEFTFAKVQLKQKKIHHLKVDNSVKLAKSDKAKRKRRSKSHIRTKSQDRSRGSVTSKHELIIYDS